MPPVPGPARLIHSPTDAGALANAPNYQPTDAERLNNVYDPWRHAHVPRQGDTVISRTHNCLGIAIQVDPQRRRALLHIERPEGALREWHWCSMIRKHRPAPSQPMPVAEFIHAHCVCGDGAWILSSDLHEAYSVWARAQGRPLFSWTALRFRLKRLGFKAAMRWTGEPGSRRKVRCWMGLTLR